MTTIRSFATQFMAPAGALSLSLALMGATIAMPVTPSEAPVVATEALV